MSMSYVVSAVLGATLVVLGCGETVSPTSTEVGPSFFIAPAETIHKHLTEGPLEILISLPESTEYVFEIEYSGPAAQIQDLVPAEFEVTDLSASAGTPDQYTDNMGKSATYLWWDVPAGSNTLTVTIETRESPGNRNGKPPKFKPTSCGPLTINTGATAFGVDADGNVVGGTLIYDGIVVVGGDLLIAGPSNSLGVQAVGENPCEDGADEDDVGGEGGGGGGGWGRGGRPR